jgi:pilus assembly protein CpaE
MSQTPEVLVFAADRLRADTLVKNLAPRLTERARLVAVDLASLSGEANGSSPAAWLGLAAREDDPVFAAVTAGGEVRPPLVLAGPSADAALVLRAMRIGADEFVGSDEGLDAIERVLRGVLSSHASRQALAEGQVIGVLGAKGGVGTTALATQLAVSIQAQAGRTALFDLGQAPGDVSIQLDLSPSYALARAAQETDEFDAVFLRSLLVNHASGVEVLAATAASEDAERLTGLAVDQALALLRTEFDWVVADLGRGWSEGTVRALDALGPILVVTQAEVPCLVNARRQLDLLGDLGVAVERVHLIENRHGRDDAIPERDLRRFLGSEIEARIPEDAAVSRCANEGKTLAEGAPYGEAQRAVVALGRQVLAWCGHDDVRPVRRGLLERVKVGLARRGRGAA